jgi:hypothetical protein
MVETFPSSLQGSYGSNYRRLVLSSVVLLFILLFLVNNYEWAISTRYEHIALYYFFCMCFMVATYQIYKLLRLKVIIVQNRVDQQFFGPNATWTRVGKLGLGLTPAGDIADIASFVTGRDIGQLASISKNGNLDYPGIKDRKDSFFGEALPMMKMRTDMFWGME